MLLDTGAGSAAAQDRSRPLPVGTCDEEDEQLLQAKLERLLTPLDDAEDDAKGGKPAGPILAMTLPQRQWARLERSLGLVSCWLVYGGGPRAVGRHAGLPACLAS